LKLLRCELKLLGKISATKTRYHSQITHQYGFTLTEEDMFAYIFRHNAKEMRGRQIYSQLECVDCLRLTNKMLQEELQGILAQKEKIERQQDVQSIARAAATQGSTQPARPKSNTNSMY
jgi:hypothetical protein